MKSIGKGFRIHQLHEWARRNRRYEDKPAHLVAVDMAVEWFERLLFVAGFAAGVAFCALVRYFGA